MKLGEIVAGPSLIHFNTTTPTTPSKRLGTRASPHSPSVGSHLSYFSDAQVLHFTTTRSGHKSFVSLDDHDAESVTRHGRSVFPSASASARLLLTLLQVCSQVLETGQRLESWRLSLNSPTCYPSHPLKNPTPNTLRNSLNDPELPLNTPTTTRIHGLALTYPASDHDFRSHLTPIPQMPSIFQLFNNFSIQVQLCFTQHTLTTTMTYGKGYMSTGSSGDHSVFSDRLSRSLSTKHPLYSPEIPWVLCPLTPSTLLLPLCPHRQRATRAHHNQSTTHNDPHRSCPRLRDLRR